MTEPLDIRHLNSCCQQACPHPFDFSDWTFAPAAMVKRSAQKASKGSQGYIRKETIRDWRPRLGLQAPLLHHVFDTFLEVICHKLASLTSFTASLCPTALLGSA